MSMKIWLFLVGAYILLRYVVFPALGDSGWVPTTPYFVASCTCGVIVGLLLARHSVREFAERWKKTPTAPSGLKARKRGFLVLCLMPWLVLFTMLLVGFSVLQDARSERGGALLKYDEQLADIARREAQGTTGEAIEQERRSAEFWRQQLLGRRERARLSLLFWASILAAPCIASFRFRSMLPELDADEATDGT